MCLWELVGLRFAGQAGSLDILGQGLMLHVPVEFRLSQGNLSFAFQDFQLIEAHPD